MGRSGTKRRKDVESEPQPAGRFISWSRFGDWGLSYLLLLAATPASPGEDVTVVASGAEAVLAPDWAWAPLVTVGEWPLWLVAAGMALLIVQLLKAVFQQSAGFERYAFLVSLSLLARPTDLMTGAILLAARLWWSSGAEGQASRRNVVVLVSLAVSAVASCLDFSIVLCLLLCFWILRGGRRSWKTLLQLPLAMLVGCGISSAFSSGFAAALARPVSWLTVPEQLVPMSPFLVDYWSEWLTTGLLVVCVVIVWRVAWPAIQGSVSLLAVNTVLSLLALSCRYYSWSSLIGLLCLAEWSTSRTEPAGRGRSWQLVAVVVVLACLLPRSRTAWLFAVTGSWPQESIDPTEWRSSGPVLLMEPAMANRWQVQALRGRHRVLINDRWDLFASEYPMYLMLARDLSEIRNSHYLLNDETWGGYRHWLDLWQPSLLEVSASDTDSLRRLSLSPHWKVMGIDSRRVVFGLKDLSGNKTQIQRMATLLEELEWPSPQFDGHLNGAIVAVGDQQRMTVARVLLALRLPYAAMRLLPERRGDSDLMQAMCHFELAHRIFRQTRMSSLLDQYRAISQLREALKRDRLTDKQKLRIALGLEELGEIESAMEFAGHIAEAVTRSDADAVRPRVVAIIERCRRKLNDSKTVTSPEGAEELVRRALLAGRSEVAKVSLGDCPEAAREFYGLLVSADEAGAETLYRNLIEQLNRRDFPSALRAEATFYLASLAVEIGDSPGAAQAFMESIRIDSTLPLNSVGRVSLSGLHKAGRP